MGKLTYGTVAPAYGRDYRTWQGAQGAFTEGKDFVLCSPVASGGTYCSIRDFKSGAVVCIRFNRRESFVLYRIPHLPE